MLKKSTILFEWAVHDRSRLRKFFWLVNTPIFDFHPYLSYALAIISTTAKKGTIEHEKDLASIFSLHGLRCTDSR